VWGFVKPWLDEVTVSKIDILSSDYVKTLAQQIPLENLPKFLGGKCECPGGCTLSNAGPWQDKELVQRVLAKNKAAKDHASGKTKAPEAKESAPAAAATRAAAAPAPVPAAAPAHASAASTSSAPVPAVEPAAIETPLPEPSTVDKIQQDLANVKMTVVESKVDV
jgi:hypothetical protein